MLPKVIEDQDIKWRITVTKETPMTPNEMVDWTTLATDFPQYEWQFAMVQFAIDGKRLSNEHNFGNEQVVSSIFTHPKPTQATLNVLEYVNHDSSQNLTEAEAVPNHL